MKLSKPVWIAALLLMGLIALVPVPAFAQGCALCYTQAASSGSRMIQALRSGILVLIAPPTFMTIGMIFICYRKRNQTRNNDRDQSDLDWRNNDWKRNDSRNEDRGKDDWN
jgi:formate hydrogenlyase subunit 3/multisubunit Na+/H+ antiporter MnhD subunit